MRERRKILSEIPKINISQKVSIKDVPSYNFPRIENQKGSQIIPHLIPILTVQVIVMRA